MQRKLFDGLFQQTISLLLPDAFLLACLGVGRRGEHPQLIRNRYLSAGNAARQKPFCISQSPRNLQHLNKPHGERDEFFTPVFPNLIIIKNSMQAEEGNVPVTFRFY